MPSLSSSLLSLPSVPSSPRAALAAERSPQGVEPAPAGTGLRELYVHACDAEGELALRRVAPALRTELHRLVPDPPAALAVLREEAIAWSARDSARYRALGDDGDDLATVQAMARRVALGCAPLGLLSGAWLQWLTAPGNSDSPFGLAVLAAYATDVGVGRAEGSRGSAYLALLRQLSVATYAVPAGRLAADRRVPDSALYLPAILLAMSRHPDELAAEIAGADLCLRAIGPPPALVLVRDAGLTSADWDALDPRIRREPDSASGLALMTDAVAAVGTAGEAAKRIRTGFAWALAAVQRWSAGLHDDVRATRDPRHEMAELLRARAHEAAVYHQGFRLQGRPLSAWMADCERDTDGLLDALAGSKLVHPGRADRSPLVRGLISERGAMFRVLSPDDLAVIRRWIDSLPSDGARAGTVRPPAVRPPAVRVPEPLLRAEREPGRSPADLREAYHLLQRRTDTVALRRYALGYVRGWLVRSAHRIERSDHPLPARWGPEGLRPWLARQYDEHARAFEESASMPLPSHEALIEETIQLAPLTLIDGSWLQGFTDHGHASSEIGHFLFETYWDELGNGDAGLNHPLIYREVLADMGAQPPPTASIEFARWPRFAEASFELPVYWLCIGRFPQTFLPEILGLNLAMELSGVGGTYRRAHLALKQHGYSTRFVDIHNTIDNVATGHSAWAADALDAYLSALGDSHGAAARGAAWQRIRVGYRSLNPPTDRRARRAGRRARQPEATHA
ncbi:MAG: iron-containing redox enzyme family protein [Frankiaceae bacterium]